MPKPADVEAALADIVSRVLGCDPDDVVPGASLVELGADSLTIVEIGEELGRRFDLYLTDQTIDGLRTVDDAVRAVVRHDGSGPTAHDAPPVPAHPLSSTAPNGTLGAQETDGAATSLLDDGPPVDPEVAGRRAWRATRWLAVVGVVIGGGIGLVLAALVGASGLGDVDLPPLPSSTTAAPTPTATTPSPSPTPTDEATDTTPEPTLTAEKSQVAPGERFILSGSFPELGEGAVLQVEVRENGGSWDEFPVKAQTRDGGEFRTELYTSRTGAREFRLRSIETDETTPVVKVTIG